MNVKDKVLVGIIADMENAARNQDDYIENLDDKLSCAEDTIRGLTAEKIQATEVFHASCVDRDERIRRLAAKLAKQSCGECNIKKELDFKLEVAISRASKFDNEAEEYSREADTFSAKASKLNAEKLKLLRLAEVYMVGTAYDEFLTEYKAWLKKRGKK